MTESPVSAFGVSDLRAPVLGRDTELRALKAVAEKAVESSKAQVVTLVGAAGVGKTRLVHELLLDVRVSAGQAPRVFRGSARSIGQAYGLFARLLRSRFGLVEGMDAEAAKAQLRSQVAGVLDDRKVGDVCYFLGQLLGLDFLESPLTKAVEGDALEARLLRRAIVRSFFDADALNSPLCLVFEDLHLADDDSIELLKYLVEQLSGAVLTICVARPELMARVGDWTTLAASHHLKLELAPLSQADSVAVASSLLAPCVGGAPPQLVEAAVGMAGGNPRLIEQMVRIFHDTGVLDERDALAKEPVWKVDLDRLASARLPLSVEDAVQARIAALGASERRVLEHAAAMGSVFWLGGLTALSRAERSPPELWTGDNDSEQLLKTVQRLVSRDYLLPLPDSAFPGETEYIFKHNLEREKISQLTSSAALTGYHQVVADFLGGNEGVRSQEEYCAMLAGHLADAGATERAGVTFLDAGDLARGNYAAKKAAEYYRRGLQLVGDSDARRRIEALHNFGDVLTLLGRTDEALAAFREMLAVAYRLGAMAKGGAAHNRIGRLYRDTGSLSQAATHLDAATSLFEKAQDTRGVSACIDDSGKLLWLKGDYDAALEKMKTALEMRKTLGDRRSIALSLNNIGLVWMDHGRTKSAADAFDAALKIRREIGDPLGLVQTLNNLGRLAQEQGDDQQALAYFNEAHAQAKEIGEHNRIAVVLTNIGETHYRMGNTEEAVAVLSQAESLCDEMGDRLHLAEAKRALAKAFLLQGELRKARESIKSAVDLFGQIRSKSHLATALRTLGEITGAGAWGAGHENKAVGYFMRSVALFKEIENELETAKSYRAFASYVQGSEHYTGNVDIQREATKLSEMAQEIFDRHRRAFGPEEG